MHTLPEICNKIKIPEGHIWSYDNLPRYYDVMPWNYIASIVKTHDKPLSLIDIGANIGDSASLWRSYFNESYDAVCVEPDNRFYKLLQHNVDIIGGCKTFNCLYNAGISIDKLNYQSDGSQTGVTTLKESNCTTPCIDFDTIDINRLVKQINNSTAVFKTDTDGFDLHILKNVIDTFKNDTRATFPVIFSEGPEKHDYTNKKQIHEWVDVLKQYVDIGYKVVLFSNFGHPYIFCGQHKAIVESAFLGLHHSFLNKRPICHYVDIILTDSPQAFDLYCKL